MGSRRRDPSGLRCVLRRSDGCAGGTARTPQLALGLCTSAFATAVLDASVRFCPNSARPRWRTKGRRQGSLAQWRTVARSGQVLKVGTYLRAKGLEIKYVYLPCHDRGLKAAQLEGSADVDRLALARRQLFVAMTRARNLLWLGSITGGAPAISMNGC